MEFERLVSSLDRESLAYAAEALLRALSGEGAAEGTPSLSAPASSARQERRAPGSLPLSAPGSARPLPGAEDAAQSALAASGDFSASAAVLRGAEAEAAKAAARLEERLAAVSERNRRVMAAGAAARPEERLAAVSERNRRVMAAGTAARPEERLAAVPERDRRIMAAGTETAAPYLSADAPATGAAAAAEAEPLSAFPAPRRAAGPGAEAVPGEADTEDAPAVADAAERDYFNAEAVSEFFRRDSRRYDFGFSD